MTQRRITICGKEIDIFYCAATEKGFETMTDKTVAVFWPTFKQNEQGETVLDQMPTAKTGDYLYLAIAGIVAADTYYKRESIDTNDILFNATPEERNLLVQTIAELRDEWYGIPKVVADAVAKENKADDVKAKN
jgi:hypothetical protein